jgi:hypothetical protein
VRLDEALRLLGFLLGRRPAVLRRLATRHEIKRETGFGGLRLRLVGRQRHGDTLREVEHVLRVVGALDLNQPGQVVAVVGPEPGVSVEAAVSRILSESRINTDFDREFKSAI